MTKATLLSGKQLIKAVRSLSVFKLNAQNKKLIGTFDFDTHVNALVFVAKVTVHAEVAHHHPDITFTFKKVKVILTTHDVKGLTRTDVDLAQKIESLYER